MCDVKQRRKTKAKESREEKRGVRCRNGEHSYSSFPPPPPPLVTSRSLGKLLEVLLSADTGAGIEVELHLAELLVDVLHKLNDKVDELVLVHLLRVRVGDQEADVVALSTKMDGLEFGHKIRRKKNQQNRHEHSSNSRWEKSYGDGLAAEDNKVLGAHHHEARKLVAEDAVHVVDLLDADADANRVDRTLNEDALVLCTADHNRCQEHLFALAAK